MKFLITGSRGFVGPHLSERLLRDRHTVYGLDRGNNKENTIVGVKYIYGDVRNPLEDIFKSIEFDGIYHLAGFTHPPTSFIVPEKAMDVNTMGTVNLVNTVLKYQPNCVFMQCSTPEVYGILPEDYKITEDTLLNPPNPYGVSKACADLYVIERSRNAGLKSFITRAFSHTGSRRPSNYSISSDARQIARILLDKQEPIIKVGNLEAQRVVADVRDVVDAYYRLMIEAINGNINSGEVYHIAGNDLHSIGWYLNRMLELYSVDATTKIDLKLYRPIDILIQRPDDSKIREFLNWYPVYTIDETLTSLVEYWLDKEFE